MVDVFDVANVWVRSIAGSPPRRCSRVPEPTQLTAVGHPDRPAIATARITRTTAGVEEDITLTLGYGPGETVPLDAALVTQHSLTTMLTTVRPARRDLAVPSRFESPPVPVAFTLGADAVADTPLLPTHAAPRSLSARSSSAPPRTRPSTMSWATGRTRRHGTCSTYRPST
ncbi:hypothetical protein HRW07_02695 [Streptomyces lunaelactis]|nr:hypothetical protein [Streptomyces lunaelactis]